MFWTDPPESVLVLRKHPDRDVTGPFCKMTSWLVKEIGLKVYVEQDDLKDPDLNRNTDYADVKKLLIPFVNCESHDSADLIDFVICLGGDRTLLRASSIFQGRVPPVMAFNVGSQGFLTPFQYGPNFRECVSEAIEGSPSIFLRYRLDCHLNDAEITYIKTKPMEEGCKKTRQLVLNEVVINRGPSCTMSNFEIFIGNRLVTSVLGDGLIMSTPTGSTAYSVSAGASMVHPNVPCVLITPICPHSLSFRPVIVPAGVQIKVKLCGESNESTCMVCFDGRERQEMKHGQVLEVTTASHPLPSICSTNETEDWFDSLANCLNWNTRLAQKPMGINEIGQNGFKATLKTNDIPKKCQSTPRDKCSGENLDKTEDYNNNTGEVEVDQGEVNLLKTNSIPRKRSEKNSDTIDSDSMERLTDSPASPQCKTGCGISSIENQIPIYSIDKQSNTTDSVIPEVSEKCLETVSHCAASSKHGTLEQSLGNNSQKSEKDMKSYHNSEITDKMRKSLGSKDNIANVTLLSSDNNFISSERTIRTTCKTVNHSTVETTDSNYITHSKYTAVNSVRKLSSGTLWETKEICGKNLPKLAPKDCKKTFKTKNIIYTNAVNSLAMDMPRKNRDHYMNSIDSYIIGKETRRKASNVTS